MTHLIRLPLIFGLILLPFSELLFIIYPARIIDTNVFLILAIFLIFIPGIFLALIMPKFDSSDISLLMIFFILFLSIFLIRTFFYNDSLSILSLRYILVPIIIAIIFKRFFDIYEKEALGYWLMWIVAFCSLIQLVIYFYFPEISIISADKSDSGDPEFSFRGDPTRDGMFGASILAYYCISALLIIRHKIYYDQISSNNLFTNLILSALFILTILVTQNRTSFIFLVFIFLNDFHKFFTLKTSHFKWIAGISFFAISSISIILIIDFNQLLNYGLFTRIKEGLGLFTYESLYDQSALLENSRINKFTQSINILFSEWYYFFIGAEGSAIIQPNFYTGAVFSDNSYLLILLNFGVVLFFFWLVTFFYATDFFDANKDGIVKSWFLISLFLSNSILWEFYILISVYTLLLTKKET